MINLKNTNLGRLILSIVDKRLSTLPGNLVPGENITITDNVISSSVPMGPEGPQGPQGIQGIQGEQGPAGADGADGTPWVSVYDSGEAPGFDAFSFMYMQAPKGITVVRNYGRTAFIVKATDGAYGNMELAFMVSDSTYPYGFYIASDGDDYQRLVLDSATSNQGHVVDFSTYFVDLLNLNPTMTFQQAMNALEQAAGADKSGYAHFFIDSLVAGRGHPFLGYNLPTSDFLIQVWTGETEGMSMAIAYPTAMTGTPIMTIAFRGYYDSTWNLY